MVWTPGPTGLQQPEAPTGTEVKLGPIMDTLLRYNTTLERDLDRTISLLTKLQTPAD
jgi:hypothetical protein